MRPEPFRSLPGLDLGVRDGQFGRDVEEFEVGAVYRLWPGKTITESDDHLFLITTNHHPLHLDAHHAQTATRVCDGAALTTVPR